MANPRPKPRYGGTGQGEAAIKKSFRAAMKRWCTLHAEQILDQVIEHGTISEKLTALKLASENAFGQPRHKMDPRAEGPRPARNDPGIPGPSGPIPQV